MASRSLSDSKLPLAELEIEEEIAKKQKRHLIDRTSLRSEESSKRDSRTGEAIGSKMCREHPERCMVSRRRK